jgi:hypothetical protein
VYFDIPVPKSRVLKITLPGLIYRPVPPYILHVSIPRNTSQQIPTSYLYPNHPFYTDHIHPIYIIGPSHPQTPNSKSKLKNAETMPNAKTSSSLLSFNYTVHRAPREPCCAVWTWGLTVRSMEGMVVGVSVFEMEAHEATPQTPAYTAQRKMLHVFVINLDYTVW